jgi:hypothetical protein
MRVCIVPRCRSTERYIVLYMVPSQLNLLCRSHAGTLPAERCKHVSCSPGAAEACRRVTRLEGAPSLLHLGRIVTLQDGEAPSTLQTLPQS